MRALGPEYGSRAWVHFWRLPSKRVPSKRVPSGRVPSKKVPSKRGLLHQGTLQEGILQQGTLLEGVFQQGTVAMAAMDGLKDTNLRWALYSGLRGDPPASEVDKT